MKFTAFSFGRSESKEIVLEPGLSKTDPLPQGYVWLTNQTGFTIEPVPEFKIIARSGARGYDVGAEGWIRRADSGVLARVITIEFAGYLPRSRLTYRPIEHLIASHASLALHADALAFDFKLTVNSFDGKDRRVILTSVEKYSLRQLAECFK